MNYVESDIVSISDTGVADTVVQVVVLWRRRIPASTIRVNVENCERGAANYGHGLRHGLVSVGVWRYSIIVGVAI